MTVTRTNETPVTATKKRRFALVPSSMGTRFRDYWSYLLIFGFVAVAVAGLIWYRVATEYQTEMNHWQARQSSLADDRVAMVSAWLEERQAVAQVLAGDRVTVLFNRGGGDFSGAPVSAEAAGTEERSAFSFHQACL